MRTIKFLALAACCTQPVAALAATFEIDSSQSYVSIETPAWQRGLPWGFILPGGELTVQGYEWSLGNETRRFGLAGSLDVAILDTYSYRGGRDAVLNSAQMASLAPVEIGFHLPSSAWTGSSDRDIFWNNSCTNYPGWCYQPGRYEGMAGHFSGGALTIDGVSNGNVLMGGTVFGGLEAPPLPEFSLAESGYTYHIVATIPEPSGGLMMVAGLAVVFLRRERRG